MAQLTSKKKERAMEQGQRAGGRKVGGNIDRAEVKARCLYVPTASGQSHVIG